MDLKFPRKSLLERGGFSSAKGVFLAVAGLLIVVGIGLRVSHYFGEGPADEKAPAAVEAQKSTPAAPPTAPPTAEPSEPIPKSPPATQDTATAPNEPAEPASDPAGQAAPENAVVEQAEPEDDALDQADLPEGVDPSAILVSKQPVEVLASPSSTAPAMFGFPAGRPFRVIDREGGFVRIKDLRSGASGWIEEAALAPAKRAEPRAAPAESQSTGGGGRSATPSSGSKPKATKKDTEVTATEDAVQPRRRPGLFGKGGLFGGIFGGN